MREFRYNDILNMEYPNPETEKDFPDKILREAQFAPFAALTGYDDTIYETARQTTGKSELDEYELEKLNEETLFIVETAAYVHDIGIKISEHKYGSSAGKYQEIEGPAEAEKMLEQLGFDKKVINRVSYLVGHHHTYDNIDGVDYQILVEADFLVNAYEDMMSAESIMNVRKRIFRTKSGTELLGTLFPAVEE